MNFLIGCCEKQPIRKLGKRLRSYEKENRSLIPAGDKVPIYDRSLNTVLCVDLGKHGFCIYFSLHFSKRIDAKRTVFVRDTPLVHSSRTWELEIIKTSHCLFSFEMYSL